MVLQMPEDMKILLKHLLPASETSVPLLQSPCFYFCPIACLLLFLLDDIFVVAVAGPPVGSAASMVLGGIPWRNERALEGQTTNML